MDEQGKDGQGQDRPQQLKLKRAERKDFRGRWAIEVRRASDGAPLVFIPNLSRREAVSAAMDVATVGTLNPPLVAREVHVVLGRMESFPGRAAMPPKRGYELDVEPMDERRTDILTAYFEDCGANR